MKILLTTLVCCLVLTIQAEPVTREQMLKRLYETRMRLEQDRLRADQAARANGSRINAAINRPDAAPSVIQMRRETRTVLNQLTQNNRCLGMDVKSNGGNTIVVCGDNTGLIESENTIAGRDIQTGGAP